MDLILVWYTIKLKSRLKQYMLGICQAIPLILMWKCTYWPLTSYRDIRRSNQLSPPWKLIGMDHSTLWAMVSFINIWSPLKSFLSLFWNFADCLMGVKSVIMTRDYIIPYATSFRRRFFAYHHAMTHPHLNIILSLFSIPLVLKCAAKILKIGLKIKI